MMNHPPLRSLLLVALFATAAHGDFPELFNSEPIAEATRMPAQQAAEAMQLPAELTASVFAAEPDVQNPIAMSWDSRGRLWVAENYTYAERTQRFQLDLRDRVVIFSGTEDDHFQQRTVFTDNIQMLTGLEVDHDGVWLMCPPQLIFMPDRNHDDVPDNDGEIVLDGFTVAEANYHNFANGLRFGPDGWLYGRCGGSCPGRIGKPGAPDHQRLALEGGIWRYHPTRGDLEVLTTGTTNPWGHDWNEVGELFFTNTVNGHLWHMIPGAHFTRPFLLDPNPRTFELIDFHADHWHFDTGESWTKSRDGAANSYGGGHAHCGTMIYQGGRWPEAYRGKLFTLNLHGRRANREILRRHGSGYLAGHGEDFMLCADPWFRGMEMSSGPDGNVFVIDWSDAGECHEHTGVHRTSGRVFKLSYHGGNPPPTAGTSADLRDWSSEQLVATTASANHWQLQQARRVLAGRAAGGMDQTAAIGAARKLLDSAGEDSLAVQSLLTLHILGATDHGLLQSMSQHPSEYVRAWAVRLLTEGWTIDDALGPVWRSPEQTRLLEQQAKPLLVHFARMAREDSSPLVRLTLASTLQRLPVNFRAGLATALASHGEDADDHNLPLMIWYGLTPLASDNPAQLVEVAKECRLPTTLRLIARSVAAEMEHHPQTLNDLISLAAERDSGFRATTLAGIAQGLKGWRQAPQPEAWDRIVQLDEPGTAAVVRELSVVFGDGRALQELKAIAKGDIESDPEIRLAALETLIQSDTDDLRTICESLLTDQRMNVVAAQGLAKFDDPAIGNSLVSRYQNFRAPFRPQIMSILVSRPSFAKQMLEAIRQGKIPRLDLSAYQVRQIHSMGDPELSKLVGEVWGEVRDTPQAKQQAIDALKKNLTAETLANANKSQGRALFAKLCQNCHRLYGEGAQVGPDLTGSNRSNLDYLLTNIVDPSAVVDKDFRMSILLLDGARIVTGLVTADTARTVTLQTATELLTIDADTIESRKITEKSPMPDGLLDALSPEQIGDLIGYLSHPSQVPLP